MSETKEPEQLPCPVEGNYHAARIRWAMDTCPCRVPAPAPQWSAEPPKEEGVYAWTKNGKIAVIVLFSAQDAREFCEGYPDLLWCKIAVPPLPERKESDE
jgi:hypothetical protein